VLYVLQAACVEVVETDDAMALGQQPFAEVRAQKAGSAGDYRCWHASPLVACA